MVTAITTVLIYAVQVILQVFGIGVSKDGVNINWRRLVLWALVSPIIALVAGRVISVFSASIQMFKQWGGEGEVFFVGLQPFLRTYLLPQIGTGYNAAIRYLAYHLIMFFAVDHILLLSLQILGIRILLKNSERFFAAITATIHTTIATVSK